MAFPSHQNERAIVDAYRSGATLTDIAKTCGCARSTVSRIAKKNGLQRDALARGVVKKAVVAGMLAGKTRQMIADETGYKRKSIDKLCAIMGFKGDNHVG